MLLKMAEQRTSKLCLFTKPTIKLAKTVSINFIRALETNLETYNNQGNAVKKRNCYIL